MKVAHIKNLSSAKLITWSGWALYYWDHNHACALFEKRPKQWEPGCYAFDKQIADISPYLLRDLGVDVPFDGNNDFYYGGKRKGEHPPIRLNIIMPEPLMYQLRLI